MSEKLSREQRKANTAEKIIKSAIKVFGEKGYTNASLTEIAAGAGVSQGLVSQRYETKENLFIEALETSPMPSFFEAEENRHMPGALNTYIDHLKDEALNDRAWFNFISLLHSGTDLPDFVRFKTKEIFYASQVAGALTEAQEKGDLPAGDVWQIFKVFFRNATNLIKYYLDNSLPMPDNKFFLYAIQYNPVERALETTISRQKEELDSMQTDQELLLAAVRTMYPLIIFCNLSRNSYHMIEYDGFSTKKAFAEGSYDGLIEVGASTVPDEVQADQFRNLFGRQNIMEAFAAGKTEVSLRHQQTGDDGIVRWMETKVIARCCPCEEVLGTALSRCIDDEMSRLEQFEEALLKAEDDSRSKQRFMNELSHNVRTLMSHVIGSIELAEKKLNGNPPAARNITAAGKAAGQLMELLDNVMNYANSAGTDLNLHIVPMDMNEVSATVMLQARKLAALKNITVEHEFINMKNFNLYADEVKVRLIAANILSNAVKFSPENGQIRVSCEQLECQERPYAIYKWQVADNGVGIAPDYLAKIGEPFSKEKITAKSRTFGLGVGLSLVKQYLEAMGASISFESAVGKGTVVTCVFKFLIRE